MSHLRITSTGPRSTRIELDGVDISDRVGSASIQLDAAERPYVTLTMCPDHVDLDLERDDAAIVEHLWKPETRERETPRAVGTHRGRVFRDAVLVAIVLRVAT